MLIEDKAKFIGMVISLSFSAIIITLQAAIFIGLMMRTYSTITDTPQADIWVMDTNVKMLDDIQPMRDTDLYRIRSLDGVAWAVPFFKGSIRARLPNGQYQTCILIGFDDSTFIGAPHTLLEGNLDDIRSADAIIVDTFGAEDKLAQDQPDGQSKIPLRMGDTIELNDQRAHVVGICKVTRTFQTQPVIYTTYKRALAYAPYERKLLSFVLVKAQAGVDKQKLCSYIMKSTHFAAYTKEQFQALTIDYYLENTGIPLNFGLAVLLGILIGAAITGQIFYNFTSDNLKYLALLNLMGASQELLSKITLLQALWVALLGWGIGSGSAALIGYLTRNTELSFHLPWELFIGTGLIMMCICFVASLISIRRIFNIELGIIFKQ